MEYLGGVVGLYVLIILLKSPVFVHMVHICPLFTKNHNLPFMCHYLYYKKL